MLCYCYKPAVSWLSWRIEHGKGKWKYNKDILKKLLKNWKQQVLNIILPFPLCFILLNDFYTLIFLNDFQ